MIITGGPKTIKKDFSHKFTSSHVKCPIVSYQIYGIEYDGIKLSNQTSFLKLGEKTDEVNDTGILVIFETSQTLRKSNIHILAVNNAGVTSLETETIATLLIVDAPNMAPTFKDELPGWVEINLEQNSTYEY